MGAPGKGPKILPKPKDTGFFTDEGYGIHLSAKERQRILCRLVKKHGEVKVMRHLNLIRNYNTRGTPNYKKFSADVKFLEDPDC